MKRPTSPAGERGHETRLEPASTARDAVRSRRLLRAAQRGDRAARDQLVTSGLGLVRSVASHYRDLGLPLDDLVQEGAIGLLDAIDHYDPGRGASFETYARFRVRRAIRNALTDKARLIRLPKQVVERRRAIERAEARLAATAAGRQPTPAEIADATGLPVGSVLEARTASMATVSLDEPVLPEGSPLSGLVADPRAADPELIALERERTRQLTAAVADLSDRQRRIVSCRWGLSEPPVSNGALAARLELSPRRTQTIGRDALYELRKALDPARSP
jgi:RNA polymerase primary sigma factor